MRKFYYTFEAGAVDNWDYCPKCGEELIEVYAGDFYGHMMCGTDDCDGMYDDFMLSWEDE